jgi:DNA-binding MarR family transcriptional regulator
MADGDRADPPTSPYDGPLVDPLDDIGLLSVVVGDATAERVLSRLVADGFGDVRTTHGYVFQAVLGGDRTTTEIARRLGVTVQAVSKWVIELERAGYLRRTPTAEDGRARAIGLTARGRELIAASRRARRDVATDLAAGLGDHDAERLAALLRRAVEHLGRTDAIGRRRLRPPP